MACIEAIVGWAKALARHISSAETRVRRGHHRHRREPHVPWWARRTIGISLLHGVACAHSPSKTGVNALMATLRRRRVVEQDFHMADAHIRINGQDEILSVATLAALLEEKAVDTEQRGIAVALNGAVVPRVAWKETPLRAGDTIEIVRARQGG